jgi:hypothetical protein
MRSDALGCGQKHRRIRLPPGKTPAEAEAVGVNLLLQQNRRLENV